MKSAKNKSHRFQTEAQFGLLAVILVLLCLNFFSNYIIYQSRSQQSDAALTRFIAAARETSRSVSPDIIAKLSNKSRDRLLVRYGLSSITLLGSRPEATDVMGRRDWFKSFVRQLPPHQVSKLAARILSAEFSTLTRGEGDEYFYVYPLSSARGKNLIILSARIPHLANLTDASDSILYAVVISIIAVVILSLVLSRIIAAPFHKLKKEAIKAGRRIESEGDDIETVLADYRAMIDEMGTKERQLKELNLRLTRQADRLYRFNEDILRSIDSGIITVDNSGKIISVNRAAETMFDLINKELMDTKAGELATIPVELLAMLKMAWKEGRATSYTELQVKRGHSRMILLGAVCSVVRDENGDMQGASLVVNDVTEMSALRTELGIKSRLSALGEMAGGLAHQLRNSLGAISGYARLAEKKLGHSDRSAESLAALSEEIREAEELVRRFMSFAQPLAPMVEKMNLAELLKDLIKSLELKPEYKNISIFCRFDEEIVLDADPLLIKQALGNILDNAVAACESGGAIHVTTSCDGQMAQVKIADDGTGIPVDSLEKIFTPFYSSSPSGTGLGLPLASRIIDMHKGRISVESTEKIGSTFRINLPVSAVLQSAKDRLAVS